MIVLKLRDAKKNTYDRVHVSPGDLITLYYRTSLTTYTSNVNVGNSDCAWVFHEEQTAIIITIFESQIDFGNDRNDEKVLVACLLGPKTGTIGYLNIGRFFPQEHRQHGDMFVLYNDIMIHHIQ